MPRAAAEQRVRQRGPNNKVCVSLQRSVARCHCCICSVCVCSGQSVFTVMVSYCCCVYSRRQAGGATQHLRFLFNHLLLRPGFILAEAFFHTVKFVALLMSEVCSSLPAGPHNGSLRLCVLFRYCVQYFRLIRRHTKILVLASLSPLHNKSRCGF